MRKLNIIWVLISILSFSLDLQAQPEGKYIPAPDARKSPLALALFKLDNNYLKVTYGQPTKKGREIWGKLVPYGKIWRTGANEATEFTTTQNIRFGGKKLEAGTYTMYCVPGDKKFQIILNSELHQWGAYQYDDIKDRNVLAVNIKPEPSQDEYEAFTILLEETKKGADLIIVWDKTKIPIPIEFLN